jgi:hypothetical protein
MGEESLNGAYPIEFTINYQIPNKDYFFNLKWDGIELFFKQFSLKLQLDQHGKIHPEIQDWNEFWHRMDEIGIWGWYEEYTVTCLDSCVEGDEWEVDIIFGDMKVESHGANSYPPTFREFLKAIEELTGILIEFIQQE